ncbi:MAG: RES domain-containing protein [Rhodobacterales bacterium]|nr:RES domain-containing protein [Rhodobacterales bacterium]
MTHFPPPLGGGESRFWRLDALRHAHTWASGVGAFRVGGRWNSPGRRRVDTALDPATALLEVAVQKGDFRCLTLGRAG